MIQENAKKATDDSDFGTSGKAVVQKNAVVLNAIHSPHREQELYVFDFLHAQQFRVKVPRPLVPNLKEIPSR